MTGGPPSAHIVSSLVLGQRPKIDPKPFSPSRFGE